VSFESLLDKDERDRERRERLEAERRARGEPEPTYVWHPLNPDLDVWGKPKKKPRQRKSRK